MNLVLTPQTEELIRKEIDAGHFATAEELVEAAVSLLLAEEGEPEELDEETSRLLDERIAQMERGEWIDHATVKAQIREHIKTNG